MTVSCPAPDLHRLFFGYLQEEDIDFDLIQSITLDSSPIDFPHPIFVVPPNPTPSIPSAIATFNTKESNRTGENQSLMTEIGVVHPFIPSPPRSSDQSNQQSTTLVETESPRSGEASESTQHTYQTTSKFRTVHPPRPPTPPRPRNPSPPSYSSSEQEVARHIVAEATYLQTVPQTQLSPDVD